MQLYLHELILAVISTEAAEKNILMQDQQYLFLIFVQDHGCRVDIN